MKQNSVRRFSFLNAGKSKLIRNRKSSRYFVVRKPEIIAIKDSAFSVIAINILQAEKLLSNSASKLKVSVSKVVLKKRILY